MGLDITAYRNLGPTDIDVTTYEEFEEHDDGAMIFVPEQTLNSVENHWPGRTEGLTAGVHTYADCHCFRAGSYGGYNAWRDDLARYAGYGSAGAVWNGDVDATAFLELINFTDCDGIIGPVVAAKLAVDFTENEEVIRAKVTAERDDHDAAYWMQRYDNWKIAFEMAAQGGMVEFH